MKLGMALLSAALSFAAPVITELVPRGAERGRPFTLTFLGRELPAGAKVWSTMPATFTSVAGEKGVKFLVEPGGQQTYWDARRQTTLAGLGWPVWLEVAEGDVSTRLLDGEVFR